MPTAFGQTNSRAQMHKPKKISATALCLVLILSALPVASYLRARSAADSLIAKVPEHWDQYSQGFALLRSMSGRWGPCWQFTFVPNAYVIDPPLTLEVTLTGQAFASNPPDALAKLRALR
jgi:hypothetical protein